MSTHYFYDLINKARYLDEGIQKLSSRWRLPNVLIGRFAECTAETNSHIEAVWTNISNVQAGIEEILSKIEGTKFANSATIQEHIQKTREEYESLKAQCDVLDGVSSKDDYNYNRDEELQQTNVSNEGSNHTANEEIEFTPSLSWKRRANEKWNLNESLSTPY